MTVCEACNQDYQGKLEHHLTYHTANPVNTASYLAHLEQRIKRLEENQKRS
jgi:hypothetical protein